MSAGGEDSRGEASLEEVVTQTHHWLERFVIGLGLCPFARAPFDAGKVDIVASDASDTDALMRDLEREMDRLTQATRDDLETVLLVHPRVLTELDSYLAFVERADDRLVDRGLEGVLQLASFHPRYQFEGEAADDPANATNRSPWPMLHLLREESVSEAVDSHPDALEIPRRNVALLREMGWSAIRDQLSSGGDGDPS